MKRQAKGERSLRECIALWIEAQCCAEAAKEAAERFADAVRQCPAQAMDELYGAGGRMLRSDAPGIGFVAGMLCDALDFGGCGFYFQGEAVEAVQAGLSDAQRAGIRATVDETLDEQGERMRAVRRERTDEVEAMAEAMGWQRRQGA